MATQLPLEETCRWDVYIISNCPYLHFQLIFLISIVLSFTIALSAGGLLIYKLWRDKSPLWTDCMFEPVTGFLLWLTAAGIFRGLTLIGAVCDWNLKNMLLVSLIRNLNWFFQANAIATYLVGIFKAILRLTFHQNTATYKIKKEHGRFIPTNRSIAIIYWTWVVFYFTLSSVLGVVCGYLYKFKDSPVHSILLTVLLVFYGITSIFGVVCFLKYGTLLISLTNESVQLTGGKDVDAKKVNSVYILQYQLYKAYLRKLKIVNFALGGIILWSSIICFVLAFGGRSIFSNIKLSVVFCLIGEIGSSIMFFCALGGIYHGEMSHKVNAEVMNLKNLKNSDQWSEFSQIEQM